MKIELIIIGNEILKGEVQDKNGRWLGQHLQSLGEKLHQVSIVPDDRKAILDKLESLFSKTPHPDLLIIGGGLGPTDDDITKKTVAEYFQKSLIPSDEARQLVQKHYQRFNRKWNPEHNFYHIIPEDFIPLFNPTGLAPGFYYIHNGCSLIIAPGVPLEFRSIVDETISRKKLIPPSRPIFELKIRTKKITEELIFNDAAQSILNQIRGTCEIYSYPRSYGGVDLIIKSNQNLDSLKKDFFNSPLGPYIWQIGPLSLAELIIQKASEKKITLAVAESCTGGLISSQLTDVSGSSVCFMGGIIAYSNEMKMNFLNVNEHTLSTYGAVSKETALEMSMGAFNNLKVDIALGTTGIAGPLGGTEDKPVGTIGIGICSKNKSSSNLHYFKGDRLLLKKRFAQAALHEMLDEIKNW